MKPGVIYQGIFVNTEADTQNSNIQQECTINIYDTAVQIPDDQDPIIIDLQLAERPAIIEVIDNSEDNFTTIRSKQLQIEIFSGDGISISLFAYGADKRYKVEYLTETQNPFIGWLSISDLSMEFLPDPNIITMIANDGLGYLNDIPLTDFDNENPTHENTIMDYLAWILSKTGLSLNIVCCFNIREIGAGPINTPAPVTLVTSFVASTDTMATEVTDFFYVGQVVQITGTASNNVTFTVIGVTQTIVTLVGSDTPFTDEAGVSATFTDVTPAGNGHLFKWMWLDAKTFEDEIGTCIDSYEALLRILKEEASVYQDNGSWMIMRKDEYEFNRPFYLFTFDYQGNFISKSEAQFEKSIGVDLPLAWMEDNTQVSLERPSKSIIEVFNFEQPKELPDNVLYERGAETTRVIEVGYTAYNLDNWAIGNLWGSATTIPDIDAVILRSFNVDAEEDQRFIMFTQPAATTGAFQYIRSSPIPINFLDKFAFSFDVSGMTNPPGDGIVQVCFAVLYGTDDNVYILNPANTATTWLNTDPTPPLTWHLTNPELTLFRTGLNWAIFADDDITNWSSCLVEASPVPVDGEIRLFLFSGKQGGGVPDFNIRYQNLNYEQRSYIGGNYRKYVAQHYKVEGGTDTVAARDEEVFIASSPKKVFKGALLKINGQTEIHNGSVVFAAPDSISISGYKVVNFDTGTRIIVTGTNAGVYRITDVVYHIIGNTTEIIIREQTLTTITESATLSKYLFALANQFYDAAAYPDGDFPEDHPYGYIQAYDVWNQYNRVMSKFDGVIDGLDSEGELPDLKHKYYLTDADPMTNNKMFQLLHFSQEQHLCQWNAFLHEVADSTINKEYTGLTFKYLTETK